MNWNEGSWGSDAIDDCYWESVMGRVRVKSKRVVEENTGSDGKSDGAFESQGF